MAPLGYAILAFVIVGGVVCLAGAVLLRRWSVVQMERFQVAPPETGPTSILRWERAGAGWQRVLERLGWAFVPRNSVRLSRLRQRLAWAGFHDPRAVGLFIGAKAGVAILCGYAYTIYGLAIERALSHLLPVSAALAVAGFFLPDFWLRTRIRTRRREMLHALPEVLDLLMVCVEAGMGFDAAVGCVTEQPEARRSPLHQELLRMHLEVRAGRRREEALQAVGERAGVEDLKAVVGAFIQTDRLGTSLGKTLRVHAESARLKRRRRAEERAYLAPLKMVFPTVLFLLPVFFIVVLVPALLRLMETWQKIGR
jgi:tight adherence protein C